MKNILILLFCLKATILLSQDGFAELDRLINAFPADKNVAFQAEYTYFDNLNARVPIDSLTVQMVRRGNLYYAKLSDYELLHDGVNSLFIDHSQRRIALGKQDQAAPMLDFQQFKDLAKTGGLLLEVFQPGKGLSGLRFKAPESSASVIELVYDKDSYMLKRALLEISVPGSFGPENNTRLKAKYSNYKITTTPFPYSSSKIIRKEGKKYTGTGAYKGYQIAS